MKTKLALLLIFSFFVSESAKAQDMNVDQQQKEDKFDVPSSKTAINDALDDIKTKILKTEKKIGYLKINIEEIERFKTNLNSFEPSAIIDVINQIQEAKNNKKNDEIYDLEQSLLDKFTTLTNIYLISRYGYDITEQDRTNENDRNKIIQSITNDLIFKQITVNHEEAKNKTIFDSDEKFEKFKNTFTLNFIKDIKDKLTAAIDKEISDTKSNFASAENDLKTLKKNKRTLSEKLDEENQIDELAIKVGLPLFCLTILLLFLGPRTLRLLSKSDSVESTDERSQNVLLEISTVLLLTMSILILGLSGKIQGDVLGTLIGGISGYVLNKIRNDTK